MTKEQEDNKYVYMTMKDSYMFVFHYNEFDHLWHCFHRDDYRGYWNDRKSIKLGKGKIPELAFKNYG